MLGSIRHGKKQISPVPPWNVPSKTARQEHPRATIEAWQVIETTDFPFSIRRLARGEIKLSLSATNLLTNRFD